MKTLKFKSKKDFLFQLIILGIVGFCMNIVVLEGMGSGLDKWSFININILLLVCGFLLWLYYGTYYELTQTHLKYNCGPIKGNIEIKEIREIIKDKTLWVGLKPATARKGLIIKFGKYDEVYISPEKNDEFINHILELNDAIKIRTSDS
ncbi:MAG: PH domain-containing protein [Flavobacteriaceae bacterium]|jgi:hypothetical protein|nr:PH domain-containing protein [Flavobacteriaceae bacterium]MDG2499505.1 PH domain-containing protein [Flavobacteriaceae bacterium]